MGDFCFRLTTILSTTSRLSSTRLSSRLAHIHGNSSPNPHIPTQPNTAFSEPPILQEAHDENTQKYDFLQAGLNWSFERVMRFAVGFYGCVGALVGDIGE